MKKLIIAAFILIATTAQTFAGPIVTIHLEIGRKSLGCTKFGICDWGVGLEKSGSNATIQLIENTNTLQINLTKESIIGKEEYFKGTTINFEEEIVVPANVLKAISAKNKITIQPGQYKLIKTRDGFQINISLN